MKKFMNLRVRAKLIIAFGIVMLMALFLDATAIISVKTINDNYSYLLDYPKKGSEYLMSINRTCSDMRLATTAIMLNSTDVSMVDNYWSQFDKAYNEAVSYADMYIELNNNDTVRDETVLRENIDNMNGLKKQLTAYRENVIIASDKARSGAEYDEINSVFLNGAPIITGVVSDIGDMVVAANKFVDDSSLLNTERKYDSIWMFSIISFVIFLLSLILSILVSGHISKPLSSMSAFLNNAGKTGDISITNDNKAEKARHVGKKDEISQISISLSIFIERIREVSLALEAIANGNLDIEFAIQSEKDTLGISLIKMMNDLSGMLGELRASSEQVSAGAAQISQSAQSLASGSSEQAATIVDFSSTITTLMGQTNTNAENSEKAQLANNVTSSKLEDSINSMVEMIDAMKAIDESSGNITQIINVIDAIAFQTNILALNAAVEAARAGQHGKGFAVVAEEVRNLAAKSAQAAKETAELIENSSSRVQAGNQIAERTNSNLEIAIRNAKESTKLIELVASASAEQATAIFTISQSIDQISSVIQANSALSEQSAASAEEMSAQSMLLHQIVDGFKLKDSGLYIDGNSPFRRAHGYDDDKIDFSSNDGKY